MKKIKKLIVFVWVTLCLFAVTVNADFKQSYPVTVTDSDGRAVELFVTGDEFVSVLHDGDGYVMTYSDAGDLEYARLEDGIIVACGDEPALKYDMIPESYFTEERERVISELEAEGIAFPGRGTQLFSSDAQVKEFKGNGTVIVVPVAFSGGSTDFVGLTKSVENACEYFNEVSYGKLSLDYMDVSEGGEIYVSPRAEGYFQERSSSNTSGYSGTSQRMSRENELVKSALEFYGLPSRTTDSPIDVNGDGDNDFLVFVYNTKMELAWDTLLWPHQIQYTYDKYSVFGKGVRSWIFVPRASDDSTLCHEMYHAIGAPDLYGYTDGYNYIGMWDIMDCGNGTMLTHMKYHYGGWIDEIPEINSAGRYTINPAGEPEDNCYKIPINSEEYYIVEYRNRYSGRINYLDMWRQWHNEGLLITRVNSRLIGSGNMEAYENGAEIELVRHPALGMNTVLGTVLPEFSPDGGFDRGLASGGTDNKTVIRNIKENADGTLSFDVSFDGTAEVEYKLLDNYTVGASFVYDSNNKPYCKLAVYKVTTDSSGNNKYTLDQGNYGIRYVFLTGRETSANSVEYLDYSQPFPVSKSGMVWAYIVDSDGIRRGDASQITLHYSVPGINTARGIREYEYDVSKFYSGTGHKLVGMSFEAGEKYTGKLNMDELITFDVDGVEYRFLSQDVQGAKLSFSADKVAITAGDGSEAYMTGLYFSDYIENSRILFDISNGRKSIFENAVTVEPGGSISMSVPGGFAGEIRYTTDGTEPTAESQLYTGPITVSDDVEILAASVLDGKVIYKESLKVYVQEDYREYSVAELNSIFKNSGSAIASGSGKYIKIAYTKGEGTLILRDDRWLNVKKIVNPSESGVLYIEAAENIYVREASGDNIRLSVVDSNNQIDLTVLENTQTGINVAMHNFAEAAEFTLVAASYQGERMQNAEEVQVAVAPGATEYKDVAVSGESIKVFCIKSLTDTEPLGRAYTRE